MSDKPIDRWEKLPGTNYWYAPPKDLAELEAWLLHQRTIGPTTDDRPEYAAIMLADGQALLRNGYRALSHYTGRIVEIPPDPQNFGELERALDRLINLVRGELAETVPATLADKATPKHTLTVSVDTRTATLNGKECDLKSEQTARWLKVLAEHPGEWISGPNLKDYDDELDGARTDRLRRNLPPRIAKLVETNRRDGARLKLA